MSINLYKKRTKNGQPVLEELLSKDSTTVADKPLVYDSTNDNVKSTNDLNVNSVTASCFHGPLDGTAKNATCFDNKTYAEACADILSGCAADSNKLNGKTYSEVCADILSGTAANATCFAGKTCTEWKEIIKTTCVDNAALATNATCFNGCTYAQACTDIRDGLATQTCADAIQNCADFIQSCVSAIESKIPAQASASNQLADKDFVNSSIITNTANFRGTYACVAELPSTGNTNNDYAFVCSLNTTTGNYIYDRYKWVASDSCWVCEYELNTTGFTAEQLASINSGITSSLVAKITDVYDNTVTVCMNGECKGSFNLNQNTDVCIDLGDTIRNACCANYATSAAQASSATNATCFDGCTYACAKEDFRNGMAAAISIGDSCPYQADGNRVVHIPAYPPDLSSCAGLDCTGTVTQVKVGTTAYDPVSGVVSLPEYPTIPTTVCTAECANTVKRNTANSGSCYLALFDGNTAVNDASLYVSNSKAVTYAPATGILSTCCVKGISNLTAGNPVGCTSTTLGQSGTSIDRGSLELYATSPSIDFHVNNASADCTQRLIACCGRLRAIVNDGTGCTAAEHTACFDFCSDGTLKATCFCGTATSASYATNATCAYCASKVDVSFNTETNPTSHYLLIAGNYPEGHAYSVQSADCLYVVPSQKRLYTCNLCSLGCAELRDVCAINLCVYNDIDGNIENAWCFSGRTYASAKADILAGTASNATCFNGCTYSCAKADIRNGLISDIGVKVYCGTTCKCTLCKASNLCLSANAFNANATISTTTYPGACCTGTSNYVVTTKVCCSATADSATNATCFGGCTYDCAKADIRNGLISDIGVKVYCGTTCKCTLCKASSLCLGSNAFNSTAFTTCTGTVTGISLNGCAFTVNNGAASLTGFKPATAGVADSATNSTCFNGCTYDCAKADIINGLISDIGVNVYCGTTCKCTLAKDSSLCLSANAFNANATISTTTYPGACCTGTSNYVVTTMVCCAKTVCRLQATAGTCHLALFDNNTAVASADIRASCVCPITYCPATGVLTAVCFKGMTTNSSCFCGCTYACAKADFRSGLTGCTGTVTSINVSVNGCSGTAISTSGTVTLTNVPTCKIYKTMATASANRNVLLGEASEAAGYGCVYVGNSCKLTFNPATGVLTAKCFAGQVSLSTTSEFTCINCYTTNDDYDMAIVYCGSQPLGSVGVAEGRFRLIFNPFTGHLILRDTCNICCNDTVITSNYSDDFTICTRGGAQFGYDVAGYYENEIGCSACRSWFIFCDGYAEFNRLACKIVGICTCGYMQAEGYQLRDSAVGPSCYALLCGNYKDLGIYSYCAGTTRNILKVDSSGNTALGYCSCARNGLSVAVGYMSCSNIAGVAIGQRAQAAIDGVAIGSCTCSSGPGIAIGYKACADGLGTSGNLFGLALGYGAYSISTCFGSTASIIKMAPSYKLGSIYILSDDKQCDIFNMLYCFISKNLGSFDSFTSCCIPVGIIQDMIYRCSATGNIKSYDVSDRWLDYVVCSSTCCYFTIRGKYNIYKGCTSTNVSGCGVNAMTVIL